MEVRKLSLKCMLILTITPLSFVLGSCNSNVLDSAKKFSKYTEDLRSANDKISTEIYTSCARAAQWESLEDSDSRVAFQKQLAVCDKSFRQASQNTNIAGAVLVNYYTAIANLATENNASYTAQFEAISDALGKLNVNGITLNENARSAGVKIADLITKILVRNYRKNQIKTAIVCTDSDIQKYSKSLGDFIDASYVDFLLNKEITQINEYHSFYVSDVGRRRRELSVPTGNPQDFITVQTRQTTLEATERSEIGKVIDRKNDGAAYVAIIRETASYHGQLKKIFNGNKDELSEKQVKKCDEYRSKAKPLVSYTIENKDQPVNEKITISELKQVEELTSDYIKKVRPLLAEVLN
jgi:hypothetical protein